MCVCVNEAFLLRSVTRYFGAFCEPRDGHGISLAWRYSTPKVTRLLLRNIVVERGILGENLNRTCRING
jgi:hypothetical protein